MADNVDITPGSGKTIATNETTINSVAVEVQRITKGAAPTLTLTQLSSVTTTAGTIIAANNSRKAFWIQPQDGDIYWGTASVGTATGTKVAAGQTWADDCYIGIVCVRASSGTVDVRAGELT